MAEAQADGNPELKAALGDAAYELKEGVHSRGLSLMLLAVAA